MKKSSKHQEMQKNDIIAFFAKEKIFFRNLHYKFTFRFRPLLSTSKRCLMEKMKNVTNLIARQIKETQYYLRSFTYRFFFQSTKIRRSKQFQVIKEKEKNAIFYCAVMKFLCEILFFFVARLQKKSPNFTAMKNQKCTILHYTVQSMHTR